MVKEELITALSDLGVHESSYSLGKLQNSDCVSVVNESDGWNVYYTERDKPVLLDSFTTESAAYDFVLAKFKKWRS